MPVKVRCPSCEKVLNAPDTARGKAIKCPGCQGKVSVPAGDGGAAKQGKATKKASDGDDFLDQLDLNAVEDQNVRVCPKCGTELDEGVTECPVCGVDARTGQVTSAFKKKAAMKGPDPALYFKMAWTDSWKFTLANKSLALRSIMYAIPFLLVAAGCVFMVWYCTRVPPMVFWAFLGLAAFLVVPGWFWHLSNEVVRGTMGKKDVLNRINFDIFANMALGVKTALWSLAFFIPPAIIAGPAYYFLKDSSPMAGAIIAGVVLLPFVLMFPVAMCHMAMPVSWKGWASPMLFPMLGSTIAHTLYWWIVALTSNALVIGALIACGVLYGSDLQSLYDAAQQDKAAEAEKAAAPPAQAQALAANPDAAGPTIPWNVLIVPSIIVTVSVIYMSFFALFNMRSLGLYAYFLIKPLALVTKAEDKAYTVKKPRPVGPDGKPIQTKAEKITASLVGVVVLLIVAAAGYYTYCNATGATPFWSSPPEIPGDPAAEQPAGDAAQPIADPQQQPPAEQAQPPAG